MFNAKMQRKAAFISILPHIKPGSLSEEKFNRQMWALDEAIEEKVKESAESERIRKQQDFVREFQLKRKMQKTLREHNLKLSAQRRAKK